MAVSSTVFLGFPGCEIGVFESCLGGGHPIKISHVSDILVGEAWER